MSASERPPLPPELGPLNDEQAQAVCHIDGPLLILAGAGSGKTRVLTRRVAYMLHAGVEPENVMAVTFTNKAAHEMKERVTELIGGRARDVWVSTFHSSCCRILRAEAEALGYTQRFAIYDDDDQNRIIRQIVADLGYDPKVVVPKAILGRIDHYKNRMMTVTRLVEERRERPTAPFVRVWEAYEEQLRAADALDFNDLIGKALELFQGHPDILERYRDRFRYVLVDEYQDTNRAQYTLLRLLTEAHRNLAVVGDDDQSIYGFRGADLRNILDFERDFPDAKIVRMEQNYRCTERILDVANAVVAKNTDRFEKRLYTDTKRGGARVTFVVHDDARAEARWVAEGARQLRRRGTPWSHVAVIYRTNATSQPFEMAFKEAQVPYKVVGGRQFYTRREIRDALAYLRLVTNPADDAAFLRVVNVPARGIGTKTLQGLRDQSAERGEPLLRTARAFSASADRAAKAVQGFVRLVDELVDVAQNASLPALVQQMLERSGYADMLRREDTTESRGRLENLQQLLRDAAGFEPSADEDVERGPMELLNAWLDRIALAGSDEEIPEDGQVTLMTVHCSKGLEYPVVFVVNMVEGQFPHARSAEEPGGVDEERRLAYVAFTRAQDRLVISRCRQTVGLDARGRPERKPVAASRFLYGIPLEACDGEPPGEEEPTVVPVSAEARDPEGPARGAAARLRALVAQQQARATVREAAPVDEHTTRPELPDGEYRTRSIESAEQVRPGVRVVHERYGIGQIAQVRLPSLFIRFRDGMRPIGVGDRQLQILVD